MIIPMTSADCVLTAEIDYYTLCSVILYAA